MTLPGTCLHFRLKHFGWANPYLRSSKYLRYKTLDPLGKWGSMPQYESILDPNPILISWQE